MSEPGVERVAPDDLDRIRRLAVPPAWTDVWIAADARSHLQCTGRDARGRKQYLYHPSFVEGRAEAKFADLVAFAQVLGRLRGRVARDLGRPGLDHDRVVATIVRLLDVTSLRIGSAEYSRENKSYGLTTLRNRHASVRGSAIRFTFRGKSGHDFDVRVEDRRLAPIVRRVQELPGQQLFEYRTPDGVVRGIGSTDVNQYLAEYAGSGTTAKTFRTWNATVRAAEEFAEVAISGLPPTKQRVNDVIAVVAGELGNTRTVCRNSYIHPAVVESFVEETLLASWQRPLSSHSRGLTVGEQRTVRLLKRSATSARRAGQQR